MTGMFPISAGIVNLSNWPAPPRPDGEMISRFR